MQTVEPDTDLIDYLVFREGCLAVTFRAAVAGARRYADGLYCLSWELS